MIRRKARLIERGVSREGEGKLQRFVGELEAKIWIVTSGPLGGKAALYHVIDSPECRSKKGD
jgi:hypothetical protein